jgi:hypothetical protein
MDDFAFGYLIYRLFYRIGDFFRHWYADGSRVIAHRFISTLEDVDQSLAVAITLRHFFQPLYKDYSVIGRILGVIFRTGRILIGGAIYLVIAALFFAFYLVWIAIPAAIIFLVLKNLQIHG